MLLPAVLVAAGGCGGAAPTLSLYIGGGTNDVVRLGLSVPLPLPLFEPPAPPVLASNAACPLRYSLSLLSVPEPEKRKNQPMQRGVGGHISLERGRVEIRGRDFGWRVQPNENQKADNASCK
ncbi:hypothetical protein CPC08DRAFT_730759 [Agrocybe pediades]|nr:hypothetical protein CPC08DRAFT_730759 [Agrocybe pediades]